MLCGRDRRGWGGAGSGRCKKDREEQDFSTHKNTYLVDNIQSVSMLAVHDVWTKSTVQEQI